MAIHSRSGQLWLDYINLFQNFFFVKQVKHLTKKWEVSIMEYQDETGTKYKVTRRIPELSVAETKIFNSKEKAKEQFEEWLS